MRDTTPTDATLTVDSIEITAEVEEHPDLSHLGTFQDTPGPDARTIDRQARGTRGRGEHQYFVAALGPDETGNPESVEQDWERAEAYGRGWVMLGIRAVATITAGGETQTLESGGLWGVASDAPDDYHESVAREEVDHLRAVLDDLGIGYPDSYPELAVEW